MPENTPANNTDSAADGLIGPLPPTENDFDESDLAKAEEYKAQGNEYFKRKYIFPN